MRITTHSAAETKHFAKKLAIKVLKEKPGKTAAVLAFSGDLGSGKTTFVQGFFKGLGIKSRAVSPTFIIFRRHRIPAPKSYKLQVSRYKFIYHMDAYRIKDTKALRHLGFKEILADPQNILLVEWAENIKKALPKKSLWIKFAHKKKENERTLISSARA
ncbi:MAG: tRNA (adenosine(37)-N6)-threonylcarbamoyltransferase complex ATPase subunit type 1 TsaE [Candidatus Liptonbacteria bacterium]|nr:tRNA (adenosine(37)-N6)-threonylcarbamoyltransferase complex ATPase subunit type 1 TsaE [Candidatus Liptonbacteria bacterium]